MIDFRYHLVSIIAVFLALAVGLLVGVTALSGPAESLLHRELDAVSRNNLTLNKDKQALRRQVGADQAFARAGAPRLLYHLLAGERVVLVVAPGADSTVTSGVTTALVQAGAKVTGQIDLKQIFLDTSGQTESALTSLAQRLQASAGVTLPDASRSAVAGQQAAATVLAAAIVSTGTGLQASSVATVLNGLGQSGYLSVSSAGGGTTMTPANLAVVIAPAGPPVAGSMSAAASKVLPAVAAKLQAVGSGAVLASPVSAMGSGSAVTVAAAAGQVSTVDNADTETGQIMVAQALSYLLCGSAPAQFGIGPGTAPSPAPTACTTSAATPAPGLSLAPSSGGKK